MKNQETNAAREIQHIDVIVTKSRQKNNRVIVTSRFANIMSGLAAVGRRLARRRTLTKMDNKRINWRFAGMLNKGYPFDSLLRQIAETADFKSGEGSEDRRGDRGGRGEEREERRGRAGGGKRGGCKETERRGERDVVSVGAAVLGYSQIGGHRQSMT